MVRVLCVTTQKIKRSYVTLEGQVAVNYLLFLSYIQSNS